MKNTLSILITGLCASLVATASAQEAPRREVNPDAKLHRFSTTVEKERPQLDEETPSALSARTANPRATSPWRGARPSRGGQNEKISGD